MSLTGITFANQKITPSDDGRLYGTILTDGILTGCAITFAAATLSIAAGSMLIGTREIKTDGETISVTGATSGFARVIVDIDLTRAATESSFLQAELQVQYAASTDAFPALEQQDINTAGTHYQAAFCVLSLGTAGITAVVASLGAARHNLTFTNVVVQASQWATDETYSDFPFRALVGLSSEVTAAMVPEVIFDVADATSGIFAPVAHSTAGGIMLYASEQPSAAVTIPTILFWR